MGGEECFPLHCLTCQEQLSTSGLDEDTSTSRNNDNVKRFTILCRALRITILPKGHGHGQGQGTDLDKAGVAPLCPSCAEMVDGLGVILEEMRSLEEEYSRRIGQLRDKLRACSVTVTSVSHPATQKEGQDHERRVHHFRQLALGLGTENPALPLGGSKRGRGRPRKVPVSGDDTPLSSLTEPRPSLDSVLEDNFHSIRIQNVLSSEEGDEVGTRLKSNSTPISTRSRSSKRRERKMQSNCKTTKSQLLDDGKIDLDSVKEESLEDPDLFDRCSARKDELEMDIKQEFDIEPGWEDGGKSDSSSPETSGLSPVQDEDDTPLSKRIGLNKNTRKRKKKSVFKDNVDVDVEEESDINRKFKSQPRRHKVKVSQNYLTTEDESESEDPDFKPEIVAKRSNTRTTFKVKVENDEDSDSDDSSGEEEDFSDMGPNPSNRSGDVSQNTIRKWKIDKKLGKMWYNGIQVIPVPEGLQCSLCTQICVGDQSPKNRSRMKNHIVTKHLANFPCPICGKRLSKQKYLDLHIKMIHEKSSFVPCTTCGKPFTSRNAMRRHSWSHLNEEERSAAVAEGRRGATNGAEKLQMLKCSQCSKICKGPYNLKKHEETHQSITERLKHMCQICGAIYSAPETLRQHIRIQHENNNQLQWLKCPHCPKRFPQNARLQKHMRVHTGERPYTCDQCGASFINANLLKVHTYKHNNIRPHPCQYCDMAFYRNYHLTRHTAVYHLNSNPPKRKLPYRSENGTRKPLNKRKPDQDSVTKGKMDDEDNENDMNECGEISAPTGPPSATVDVDLDPRQIIGLDSASPATVTGGNYAFAYNFSNPNTS